VELAAAGRRRQEEHEPGSRARAGAAAGTSDAFPADRRAQVAFIRDAFDPSFNWSDAEWLCQEWGDTGPVALKGVVRPDDALRAVQCGFDTIWVSNHGGRQLDTAPAPIDVLPHIRDALGGIEAWAAAKAAEEAVWAAAAVEGGGSHWTSGVSDTSYWMAPKSLAPHGQSSIARSREGIIDGPSVAATRRAAAAAASAAAVEVASTGGSLTRNPLAVSAKTGLPIEVNINTPKIPLKYPLNTPV
jgi:hypothetical protein